MIHTTIGLYPSGEYKVNGVKSENLGEHIAYNMNKRWGRALFLDGEMIYKGNVKGNMLVDFKDKAIRFRSDKDTAPYI
jgi:hypothetical protein